MKAAFLKLASLVFALAGLAAFAAVGEAATPLKKSSGAPPWVADLPLPQNEKLILVLKGTFSTEAEAEKRRRFIQQLMVKYPGDRVDRSDRYPGLAPGKFIVGSLFDGRERAKWWIDYSYRNRTIPRGDIHEVVLAGASDLPYFPDPVRGGKKRLFSADEAIAQVRKLSDVQELARVKTLKYKITDWPKNGDLRYEVEILEDRGRKDGVMVDFVMVSALTGEITERYAQSLGKPNFSQ